MPAETSTTAPSEERIDPRQFGEYARERQELKDIFDPLSESAAEKIHGLLAHNPAEVKELAEQLETIEIPYGQAYTLPPGLLGREGHLTPPADWQGRKNEYWLSDWYDKLLDDFIERIETEGTAYEKQRYGEVDEILHGFTLTSLPPELPFNTSRIAELKPSFTPEKWGLYFTAYTQLKEKGREQELYELNKMRMRNGHNRYAEYCDAEYDSFLYAHAEFSQHSMFENIVVPVGEYGEAYAKRLAQSTIITMEATENALKTEAAQVTKGHEELLKEHTMRGNEAENSPNGHSTTLTVQEGVLSIMQTISLLTAEKVEGYDDPARLLDDLVKAGLVEKVTRLVPPALVGPLALAGQRISHPLEVGPDGQLQLSEKFETELKAAHVQYWRDVAKSKKHSEHGHPKIGTGLTCPASGSGVRALAESLNEVYQTVS